MSRVEISLPDRLDSEIDRLVEQGEFLNRDQAIEELLAMGVSVYDVGDEPEREDEEQLFTQAIEDQQDPAAQNDSSGDEYTL